MQILIGGGHTKEGDLDALNSKGLAHIHAPLCLNGTSIYHEQTGWRYNPNG